VTARRKVRFTSYLLLAAPASWTAIGVMAKNPVGIPHAERLIGLGLLSWVLCCLTVWIGVRLGAAARPTVFAVFLVTVLAMSGRGLVDRYGYGITLLALVGVVAAAYWLAFRLSESSLPDVMLIGLAIALISGPAIDLYDSLVTRGSSSAVRPQPLGVEIADRRDIFLIVLDGHPGLEALSLDYPEPVVETVGSELAAGGYDLPDSAWSSYRGTDFSLPSVLEMGYPVDHMSSTPSSTQDMYNIISGDNLLREQLAENGYETYMIESGWSGSSCRSWYDECIASPLLDESMFIVLEKSVLGPAVLETYGYAFTAGALNAMDWLRSHGPELSENGTSDFVFAHVMAPHAPFFLDPACKKVVTEERSGVVFPRAGVDNQVRGELLLEQIECLRSFLLDFAGAIDEEAVVVVVSDHGSDRRRQLLRDPTGWTDEDIVERMNAFVAIRGLDDCPIGDEVMLPNVMRHVLSCLATDRIGPVAPRMVIGEGVELEDTQLAAIMDVD